MVHRMPDCCLAGKDLIAAAAANDYPNDRSVGRGMKVAKEQIVGMVAALDLFLDQTDEGIEAEGRRRAAVITPALRSLPTVTTEIFIPPIANHVPHLMIRYDQAASPSSPSTSPMRCARASRRSSSIRRQATSAVPPASFRMRIRLCRPMDDEPGRGRDRGAQAARSAEGGVAAAGLKAERWG